MRICVNGVKHMKRPTIADLTEKLRRAEVNASEWQAKYYAADRAREELLKKQYGIEQRVEAAEMAVLENRSLLTEYALVCTNPATSGDQKRVTTLQQLLCGIRHNPKSPNYPNLDSFNR